MTNTCPIDNILTYLGQTEFPVNYAFTTQFTVLRNLCKSGYFDQAKGHLAKMIKWPQIRNIDGRRFLNFWANEEEVVNMILREIIEREDISTCLGSQCPNKELKKEYHHIPGLPIPNDIGSVNDAKVALENWFAAGDETICGYGVVSNLSDVDVSWKEVNDLSTNEK